MDQAHRDELEARGQSLLDEEEWRRVSTSAELTITVDHDGGEVVASWGMRTQRRRRSEELRMTPDAAVTMGHALLSEAETLLRADQFGPPNADDEVPFVAAFRPGQSTNRRNTQT